jgi:RimJ/RimL family protein N-acetyltransferase
MIALARAPPGMIPPVGDVLAQTERLVIRPWRLSEADRLFDILRRTEVVRWLDGRPMGSLEEARERIERYAGWREGDPLLGRWAVVERASGRPAGTVIMKPLPNGEGEVEIGWHFHPDSWGRGLASEAAGELLSRALGRERDEIWAVTHLDNERSAAVCTRIGMRLLGVTHRWYDVPSLMFWIGARPEQRPSLAADQPAG